MCIVPPVEGSAAVMSLLPGFVNLDLYLIKKPCGNIQVDREVHHRATKPTAAPTHATLTQLPYLNLKRKRNAGLGILEQSEVASTAVSFRLLRKESKAMCRTLRNTHCPVQSARDKSALEPPKPFRESSSPSRQRSRWKLPPTIRNDILGSWEIRYSAIFRRQRSSIAYLLV